MYSSSYISSKDAEDNITMKKGDFNFIDSDCYDCKCVLTPDITQEGCIQFHAVQTGNQYVGEASIAEGVGALFRLVKRALKSPNEIQGLQLQREVSFHCASDRGRYDYTIFLGPFVGVCGILEIKTVPENPDDLYQPYILEQVAKYLRGVEIVHMVVTY
mmetsp:Transcript_30519/g.47011  ORF Transcript_30519/g.47011 Transcript_30519/m.47011 type:complete len:159 (+) Transcript_30519:269-745(+)